FVLSAIVFHESYWLDFLNDIILFRRNLKEQYGLLLKEEIHAAEFINGHPKLRYVTNKYDKLLILKECLDYLNSKSYISIVTLRYEKTNARVGKDVFSEAWNWFIQRIENTMQYGNFPGGFKKDKAILIPDNSDVKKLNAITRKMRRYNPVSNSVSFGEGARSMPLRTVIKDPIFRDSKNSYFHQMVDVVAYFARQYYEPNTFIKKKGARKYYETRLQNVTNPHVTTKTSPNNIVEV
ncbi:MAG: hypothetical protein JWP44_46, partial [Mucilaginibacter sp.]|nr:hypothetical protein [Mucilaginibacter sp.]